MRKEKNIRFASRMDQLPPYLFGMINSMKMEKRRKGDDVIDLVPIYSNPIMFAKDFSNKIFSPPRDQDTKFN